MLYPSESERAGNYKILAPCGAAVSAPRVFCVENCVHTTSKAVAAHSTFPVRYCAYWVC